MDIYSTGECRSPVWLLVHPLRFERRGNWYSLFFGLLCAAVLIVSSGGCSALQGVRDYVQYNDMTDDFVVGWRHYVWANRAWAEQKSCYAGQAYLHHFGEGFRAGYRDVAAGGNGCPPPLPPRNYWSWKYQSPEGQGKIAAWFSGYPHGAAFAEQEGAGNWREIPVSHSVQQQYSPAFEQGLIPRCDGPVFPRPTDPGHPDSYGPFDPLQPTPQNVPSGVFPGQQDHSVHEPRSAVQPASAYGPSTGWPIHRVTNSTQATLPPVPTRPYTVWEPLGGPAPPASHETHEAGSAGAAEFGDRPMHGHHAFPWGTP
jgi:hypothetical protein